MEENMPQNMPKKGNRALWIVLIVILLAIAASVYAYYLLGKDDGSENGNVNSSTSTNSESNANSAGNANAVTNANTNVSANMNAAGNQNTNSNTNSSTNTNSNVNGSGWETYRNDVVGISFDYPTDWDQSYYTESVRVQYYQDSIFAARQSYDSESATPGYGEIVVRSIPNSNNLSLNDWVQMNDPVSEAETLVSDNSTTVSGEDALYRHATNNVAGGALDTRYVLHGGNIVIIETNSRISTDHQTSQSQFDADAQSFLDSINLL